MSIHDIDTHRTKLNCSTGFLFSFFYALVRLVEAGGSNETWLNGIVKVTICHWKKRTHSINYSKKKNIRVLLRDRNEWEIMEEMETKRERNWEALRKWTHLDASLIDLILYTEIMNPIYIWHTHTHTLCLIRGRIKLNWSGIRWWYSQHIYSFCLFFYFFFYILFFGLFECFLGGRR